jgi:hypothetical protein
MALRLGIFLGFLAFSFLLYLTYFLFVFSFFRLLITLANAVEVRTVLTLLRRLISVV